MVPLRAFPTLVLTLLLLLTSAGVWISLAGVPTRSPVPFAEVAGSYYRGDGLGFNQSLDITAYGGFSFHASGCLRSYDRSKGRVLRHGSLIFLGLIAPRGWDIAESGFLPVHWGGRRYLVQAREIMSFVNEVNLGSEPRASAQGTHYLASEDWQVPVNGLPSLPASYAQYLLEEPVEGVLYRTPDEADFTFEVAAGPATGLLAPGMALVAHGGAGDQAAYCELKVVAVESATAVAERSGGVDCDGLRPGDPVSTSFKARSSL